MDVHKIFAPNLFQDKIAIITGGGSGIGKECVLQMAKLGCRKIAICGRRKEILAQTKSELEEKFKGLQIFADSCDIREIDQVEKFVSDVKSTFERIDILINNAGGQFPIKAEFLNSKGFNAVIRNNLLGTWNMTIACAKIAFIPQESGRIVNVIAQIWRGFPGMVHTGAARAGVDNMTKTLSVEWACYNIKVNAVAPGVIVSSGTDRYGDEFLAKGKKAIPLGRLGNTEEVSYLILYLASEEASSFITGQTYYIDGGQSLSGEIYAHEDFKTPKTNSKL